MSARWIAIAAGLAVLVAAASCKKEPAAEDGDLAPVPQPTWAECMDRLVASGDATGGPAASRDPVLAACCNRKCRLGDVEVDCCHAPDPDEGRDEAAVPEPDDGDAAASYFEDDSPPAEEQAEVEAHDETMGEPEPEAELPEADLPDDPDPDDDAYGKGAP